MIKIAKRIFSTELFKVTSLAGVTNIVKILSNLISSKLISIYTGSVGMALFGQLTSITALFQNTATGFVTTGLVKSISENKLNLEKRNKFIFNCFILVLFYSFITSLFILLFYNQIGEYIFHQPNYNIVIFILGLTIVFYSLNNFIISTYNGLEKYNIYTKINVVSSIISLVFNVVLIIFFKTLGLLLAYVLAPSIVFFYAYYAFRRKNFLAFDFLLFKKTFDTKVIYRLSYLSLMTIASSVSVPITQILIRNSITSKLSIEYTGIWEATNRISSMYLMLIQSSLAVYFLPRISSRMSKIEMRKEIQKIYIYIFPIIVVTAFFIFLFRNLLISLLFSSNFLPIRDILGIQLVGDQFKMVAWIFGYLLMGRGAVKRFIVCEITLNITFFVLVNQLINYYGLSGAIYGYLLNYIFASVLYFIASYRIIF